MARAFGKILTSIWQNDEFRALSSDAKTLYFHLCSRDDLSFAGRLVVRERVWCREALNGDMEAFTAAFAALVAGRYVLVDLDHQEALVRTFIRHDEAYKHSKWVKAVRAAIDGIDSTVLYETALAELERLLEDPDGDDPDTQSDGNPVATGDTPDGPPVDNSTGDNAANPQDTKPLVVPNPLPTDTQPDLNAPNTQLSVVSSQHSKNNAQSSSSNARETSSADLMLVPPRSDDDGGMFLEAVVQFIASERMQGRRCDKPDHYKASVVEDLRTNHRTAIEDMLARCDWLDTPQAAAAYYQARPELHPQEIA